MFYMAKKPSAANITHGLAQFGGGAKSEGGGMIAGLENIFNAGVNQDRQQALESNTTRKEIKSPLPLLDGDSE